MIFGGASSVLIAMLHFIPGIMNFIDDEEQPLFLILKVYFIVKLSNVKHINLMKKTLIKS